MTHEIATTTESHGTVQASTPAPSGIVICAVRVRNFRCLHRVEVPLTATTVLIGQNNAGKTSFLEAVFALLGTGPRHLSEDDIYISESEAQIPRDREVSIDLLIRPTDSNGYQTVVFPEGSPWLELWGNGIIQDESDSDLVAIRMLMAWDRIKGEYIVQRRFLRVWNTVLADASESEMAQQLPLVTQAQLMPLSLYMLDARRDASEEMRTRGSIWNKLISDHGLSEEDISTIEQQLNEINDFLVHKSPVLSHIQNNLVPVEGIVNCNAEGIAVNPVARRLRDLSKGMDVVLATKGAQQFSLSRQGMGTRSLTSILLFNAYMRWQQQNQGTRALHPFVAVEEPETHLHPQAQRALFEHLQRLPGQKLVSTHSPYICSQAQIGSFVHFFKEGSKTMVSCFYSADDTPLDGESVRAINRRVMNTRGDLLFSRCVILFEGETEEQALPMFAEQYWGVHPNQLGISFISVDGYGNYLPFLRLAARFRIPWVIFSDGESEAVKALDRALREVGEQTSDKNPRCVVLPAGKNFEQYLTTPTALAALATMIADYHIAIQGVTDPRGVDGITHSWAAKTETEIVAELDAHKTRYGARIATAYTTLASDKIPPYIKAAFDIANPKDQLSCKKDV